ncbi:Coenzyme PQQ synthesis protein E [uncultured archaeon]|nr:Coenzyme PQQ synthesis protein E [uncultured archaeon]
MKNNNLQRGLEAIKFVKSFKDLKIFYQKLAYSRVSGTRNKHFNVPPSLQIEPTNYCNSDCICCCSSRSTRKKGYMDLHLFKKIIDDAAQIRIKKIHLYLHGEPLLHPQIVEMISYIKSKNLGIHISTNGMSLNKEKIENILRTGINSADLLTFSIYGYSKDIHEKIMRGVKHDVVLKNIFDFIELRNKLHINGPAIETALFIIPENYNERDPFTKYWQGKVDHITVYENISEYFSNFGKMVPLNIHRDHTCLHLWERMCIYWNGDVTICCADINGEYIVGNLENQSIKEIWNSKQLLSIKKLHNEKQFQKHPLCSICDM